MMRLLRYATLALLLPAPVPTAAQAPPEIGEAARIAGVPFEELARRAGEAASAGRLEDALRYYRAGLVLNPRWPDGWWRLALLHFDAERYRDARDALRRLVNLEGEDGPSWALLGLSEFKLGEHDPAGASLSRSLTLGVPFDQPLGREALHHLALLLVKQGQFAAAAQRLERLVQLQPGDPELVMACGLLALRLNRLPGEVPPAERDLVAAAGWATHAAFAYKEDEARHAFEELIRRFPRARGAHYAFGLFLSRHASSDALPLLKREVELFPDNVEAQLAVASAILDRGDARDALAPARAAARLAPDSAAVRLALGRALLANDSLPEAVSELERSEKLDPGVRDVYVALARVYARLGRAKDVERVRARLLDLEPDRGAR